MNYNNLAHHRTLFLQWDVKIPIEYRLNNIHDHILLLYYIFKISLLIFLIAKTLYLLTSMKSGKKIWHQLTTYDVLAFYIIDPKMSILQRYFCKLLWIMIISTRLRNMYVLQIQQTKMKCLCINSNNDTVNLAISRNIEFRWNFS